MEQKPEIFSRRDLIKLIIPLILEQFLSNMIGMTAIIMVSGLGDAAVSGISLVDSINILLIQIFAALATGGAVITSQYLGKNDRENANASAKQLIIVSTVIAIILAIPAMLLNQKILYVIFGSVDANIMDNATIYFVLTAASYPFLAIYNACAALFRSQNNSRVPLFISFLINVINIVTIYLLLNVFNIGIAGTGWATLISRIIGGVLILLLLTNKNNDIYIENIFKIKFDFKSIKNILKIGIPNGLENSLFQVGKLLLQTLVSSFGITAITANAICNNISGLVCIPGNAIGLAMITVVGHCIGANYYEHAIKYTKKLMSVTCILMTALSIVSFIFTPQIISIYKISSEAMKSSVIILRTYFIFTTIVWPVAFTLPNSLRAAGDVKYTMLISMLSMWIFRIGFSYLLCLYFNMEVYGIWIAMIIDWIMRSVCFIWRYKRRRWMKIKII